MGNEKREKGKKVKSFTFYGKMKFFGEKMKKSCEKIWWNQIKFVPLHPLTKRKGV